MRQCTETSSDDFDACWSCGHDRDGNPPPDGFDLARAANLGAIADTGPARQISCLRCKVGMRLIGRRDFHEGSNLAPFLLGDLGELLVNRESYDVYACLRCRKLEFFLAGLQQTDDTPPFIPNTA